MSDARATGMEELVPRPEELAIAPEEVARLAQCGQGDRWVAEVRAGIAESRDLIAPHARWTPLPANRMNGLFSGGTPVETIARRGLCWAFVATIGGALGARVSEHFHEGRYLQGVILDAAGSVAVEAVCDQVEERCQGRDSSSRFSPGYCMWSLENQRMLFAILQPEEMGIRLLPSMLMHPLKSVSGLVVRSRPEELIVPVRYCEQCDARGCARRGAIG